MPTYSRNQLLDIALRILQGAGVGADEATIVATELADANMVGHDSHGIIRLKQYVDSMDAGDIKPGAMVELVTDLPSIAVIDGGYNFGQVIAVKALEMAKMRARNNGTYTVLCRNTNHVGRLGSYTRKAALDGFVALMAVNGPAGGGVIPWGGLDRRLGTNPISMAAPWNDEPIVLDMTTSATAEGKIRVASQQGDSIPEGWVIDKEGQPTTDPDDFYRGGSIVPLGGAMGFKGYGLGAMMDVFCGILSGAGIAREDLKPGSNGVWLYVIDVGQVMSNDDYTTWIEKYVEWLKSSRKAPEVTDILLPGEVESQRRSKRLEQGVLIPDATWQQTIELAERLSVVLDDLG